MFKKATLLAALWSLTSATTGSVAQIKYSVASEIQTGTGDKTAFWLVNQRHGLGSLKTDNAYLRTALYKETNSSKVFDWAAGVDVVGATGYQSNAIIQQAYLDVKYKSWLLSIGSKERGAMLKNQELSSGGMTWSGNARPIPQVRLELADYVSYPWLMKNRLKFRGSLAYGRFTDDNYQKKNVNAALYNYNSDVLYHYKSAELRYDFANSPWSLEIAGETAIQFGGFLHKPDTVLSTPSRFKNYLMALIPSQGDQNSQITDQNYVYGGTLGSWQIKANYTQKEWQLSAYLENFFEDFSGMSKQNKMDGLWGIEYKSNRACGITGVVVEYLQTTDQSGPIHWAIHDTPGTHLSYAATGSDNYYINGFYNSGWTNYGFVNGNPLLTSPVYNQNGAIEILNSRVKAFHLGIQARASKVWKGKLLLTHSRNWGRYDRPFFGIKNSLSTLGEIECNPSRWKGWKIALATATDHGEMYGNNFSVSLSVKKSGLISGR